MLELFKEILSDEQIISINSCSAKDRSHPVSALLKSQNNSYAYHNTFLALKTLLLKDKRWTQEKSAELANTDDFSASSSALGEIRTYGYLLAAGFNVEPVPTTKLPTPDFIITGHDGSTIEIEVNARQYTEDESKALETFKSTPIELEAGQRIGRREIVITPFGKPKEGESITENVISKIASIKKNDKQLSNNSPSILWIDFQDELWLLGFNAENTDPLRTFRGEFCAGEIWYALYGKKGLPIFENHTLEERAQRSKITMRHDGRYRYETKVDACILTFPKDTIVLENPFSKNKLPNWFYENMVLVTGFDVSHSWLDWPRGSLIKRVELEIERIEFLQKLGMYAW